MKNSVTSNYIIKKLKTDIDAGKYYIAVGKHEQPEYVMPTYNYPEEADVKNNLIFGKKIRATDYAILVEKIEWESGAVYEICSDTIQNKFYVINQNNDVYKCIWNNNSAKSTSEPLTKTSNLIELADGYIWKYLYTISESEMSKFSFNNKIPVFSNTSITSAAVNQTIDYIKINDGGKNYSLHNTGMITQALSSTSFKINENASPINSAYVGSMIYIKNGTSTGLLKEINSYVANSSGRFIGFNSNTVLDTTSEYYISPKLVVTDIKGTGFSGYIEINGNDSVEKIVILSHGEDYIDPTITIQTSTEVTPANLEVITSVVGGNGSDPVKELKADKIVVSTTFLKAENITLPEDLIYYNTSLLHNPNTAVSGQNTASWGISMTVANTFSVGDEVSGHVTGAKGIVYWANSTHIKMNSLQGTFANNDVISNASGSNSSINIVKVADVEYASGDVLQYNIHYEGINRATNLSEDIKFIFNLESN